MRILFPLFVIIPVIEIGLFVLAGKYIGILPTLLIVLLTGFFGARLAKREGLQVWRQAQEQLQMRKLPGEELIEGLCVLCGGVLLITPGYLTDLTGLLLLMPSVRKRLVRRVRRWLKNRLANGQFSFYFRK